MVERETRPAYSAPIVNEMQFSIFVIELKAQHCSPINVLHNLMFAVLGEGMCQRKSSTFLIYKASPTQRKIF